MNDIILAISIGTIAGLIAGWYLGAMYNNDVVRGLEQDKARILSEIAKLRDAAAAVKTDVEKV